MKRINSALFLATVASMALASGASAQTLITQTPGQTATQGNDASGGTFALLGTGATSIENVLVDEAACIKGTVCSPAPQSNFALSYEGEGSGFGRQQWRSLSNQWTVAGLTNSKGTWNHVQFAFGDSPLGVSDIATYNGSGGAGSVGGKPIMFPKYVLPVAIAYNPVYGTNGGAQMRFNVNSPKLIGTTLVGGLPLSRELYCGIFNGQIKNFNDARFTTANGGVTLRDMTNDTAARWSSNGVPVRLVGRVDRSGTTDIFTRALAAQCSGFGYTNKYTQPAETLPYNRSLPAANLPNFSSVRPDTGLSPTSSATEAGNSTGTAAQQLVGNTYWNGSGFSSVTGGLTSAPSGNQGSGRFLVANGSGGIRDAINFAPDYALGSVTLNGKIGYISSDYIANSPSGSATLFSAALQENATSSTYNVPEASFAETALNAINPPESNAMGNYTNSDTRQVPDQVTGMAVNADRANPLAWYHVLYPTALTGLANPSGGYPIVGTTQFYGYTCYTPRNREHIANLLGWETGAVTQDSAGNNRTDLIRNRIRAGNIGTLPAKWATAITQTFLTNSNQTAGGQRLGDLNLWIQNQPTPGGSANTTCTSGMGM